MSKITKQFSEFRDAGRKAFIPFITAGDPDPGTTLLIMRKLAALGSAVIELGVPFSDPMADGPVIQASSQRAIERHGIGVNDVLEIVSAFRAYSDIPVLLFGYLNPFLNYGPERLAKRASDAGVDGFLITDIIDREFDSFSNLLSEQGLDLISLVAPTTSEKRLERILNASRGFVYAISTTGVTGNAGTNALEARTLVERVRARTDLPVAVGFGISRRSDVLDVWRFADAAVVGSALVREIELGESAGDAVKRVEVFVRGLLEPQV